jgi:hypothetical protein
MRKNVLLTRNSNYRSFKILKLISKFECQREIKRKNGIGKCMNASMVLWILVMMIMTIYSPKVNTETQ